MGHGVVGTTHAEDVETLVNRVVEQGLPAYLLDELDLVVFPRHVDGERYVGEAVELVPEGDHTGEGNALSKGDTTVRWRRVAWREYDGSFRFDREASVFDRLGDLTDRPREEVVSEFDRKHRYVQYMVQAGLDDVDALFDFLADLRNDEAATVERLRREGEA